MFRLTGKTGRAILLFLMVVSAQMICSAATQEGTIKLPGLICDNMVVQRDAKVAIWGETIPGEKVTVKLGKYKAKAKADEMGRWKAIFKPMKAGGPYDMTITASDETKTIKNVCIGEVWVCSGQSNMEFSVGRAWFYAGVKDSEKEIAEANYPMIRQFGVPKTVAGKPQKDTVGSWQVCSPRTVGGFSAVAYFFGRNLNKDLNVPIGLINSSWGGMPVESFTSVPVLEANPDAKAILTRYESEAATATLQQADYPRQYQEWQKAAAENEQAGRVMSGPPSPPHDVRSDPGRPGGLYNAMIAPLSSYAIRGAIWYQGESNVTHAYQYRRFITDMIKDWRAAWGQGEFPFLIVQLANYAANDPEGTWPELREAQLMATTALPKTGMAVAVDIGESGDIHPKNKQDLGKRLALSAEAMTYGKKIESSGPIYDAMKIEGAKIRLTFKHVAGGLVAKGSDTGELKTVVIAGADKKFVPAEAKIDGDTVVVSSPAVANPVAVRYAWLNDPVGCNLYNKAELPASPFRTDDWPGVTMDK